MEKEALLTIILQDIKELETLVNTFKGKRNIPEVFIQLSKSKTQGILDEIQLLASIKETIETPSQSEYTEKPVTKSPSETGSTIQAPVEEPAALRQETEIEKTQDMNTDKPEESTQNPVEPVSATKSFVTPKESKNATVIGELLGKDKPSFNEILAGKQEPTSSKSQPPISDLRRAIGINDRFFFQRELFSGNSDLFNQTIDQLNNLNNMEAALAFISTNFNWDPHNEAVTNFLSLLRRRFIKQ